MQFSPDDAALSSVLAVLDARAILASGALARAKAAGGRADRMLVDLGLVAEDDMADAYAEALTLRRGSAADIPETPPMSDSLNPRYLSESKLLPLQIGEECLVAMADPLDPQVWSAARFIANGPVQAVIMTGSAIAEAVDRLYTQQDKPSEAEELADLTDADAERLRDLASEGPVVRLVNGAIQSAIDQGATDIHVEPMVDRLVIRQRVDGIMREQSVQPRRFATGIVTRLKVMSGLDIGERRLPQDGRIRQTLQGRDVDFRVSTTPTAHGESIVLRVLDQETAGGRLDGLGLPPAVVTSLAAELGKPHGIVLVTGPTGSGKTTTLYSGLREMDARSRKILTIEDPIEYMLDGINQTQVKPTIGLTFAQALRSFLRQDPDVILVGEIRDGETAKVAIQAALTGHLVLTTLHTNDAAGAVPRLIDMGVDSYLLATTLSGVLAQRLVRTLCPYCRAPQTLSASAAEQLGLPAEPVEVFRAVGCPACGGTGYRGRSAIAEWLAVDDGLRTLIRDHAAAADLERQSVAQGMVPLYFDGLNRVLAGQTSLEEVLRVTRTL